MALLTTFSRLTSTLSLAASLAACGNSNPVHPSEEEDPTLAALPEWPAAEQPADSIVTETKLITGADDKLSQVCTNTEHSVRQNYDEILAVGAAYSDVLPGAVLQGRSVRDGTMTAVPLARSPIQISIDLALKNPTRTVDNPTVANIQAAIAELQREADAVLVNLPAQLSFESSEVQSFEEATLAVGVHASYRGPMVGAGIDASLKASQSEQRHSVIAKLIQPMYTISLSDDRLPTARSFFADELTAEDFAEQKRLGSLGNDNLPAYVKSVTYGRLVIFSMTTVDATSSSELAAAVQASYTGFTGSADVQAKQREILRTSSLRVLAIGGPDSTANQAIQEADYSKFFGPAKATTARPLVYRIHSLSGARQNAIISDATQYKTADCGTPTGFDSCKIRLSSAHPFVLCSDKLDYLAAEAKCGKLGLGLLRLDNEPTYQWLQGEARLLNMPNYWTRAYRTLTSGWSWSRDHQDPLTFTAWNPGEPNDEYGKEDCVHIQPAAGWNDVPCDSAQAYVCSE